MASVEFGGFGMQQDQVAESRVLVGASLGASIGMQFGDSAAIGAMKVVRRAGRRQSQHRIEPCEFCFHDDLRVSSHGNAGFCLYAGVS